ncbi:MAG: ligase-associated DNA damage response DEXH box helicase, partial [Desulfobacterales bacterium]
FDFQREAWQAYLTGASGLIHASTGIGKTYAAWFGPLIEWMADHRARTNDGEGDRQESDRPPPLRVLWITPLRALAADIRDALRQTLDDFEIPWTVECRTSDTPASVRSRQKTRLPAALVTTPESLSLLLSYPDARKRFEGLCAVVVDEWHDLMGSKRGVLLELALARLRKWIPGLRTWGLSATLGNTDTAMRVLMGRRRAKGRLIEARILKSVAIESIIPAQMERFPWAGHLGLRLLPQVLDIIEAAASVLLFTNTRSQTEIWFQEILLARPEWETRIALHHGSLDRRAREAVEQGLRQGDLKCVVCTSSLDLGVDFTPVDTVIQVGSPKGIARLLQRAGRSGHRPGQQSRVICVPTNALELIEVAAAREAAAAGIIEPRRPLSRPLDVLAQHLVTVALGSGFRSAELFREIRQSHAYRDLSRPEFDWVLNFVSTGGQSLAAYSEYARIAPQHGRFTVLDPKTAARHRLNIGTITADAAVAVKFLNGRRLGTVEERFAGRLKRGACFVFAGRLLEFVRMRDMTVFVRGGRRSDGPVPQWLGGRMPLSTELAAAVRDRLDAARLDSTKSPELNAVRPLLDIQARWSAIPAKNELLIEKLITRDGHHLFIFAFGGHQVNEGLGALLAYRLAKHIPLTLSIAANDYGLELLCDRDIPTAPFESKTIFNTDELMRDILESLNVSELARRRFREIARVAGLVFQGYPGRRKSGGQVQASSGLLYNVFKRYDPGNLLVAQATRELLESQLEFERLSHSLKQMAAARLRLIETAHPTPLAFPILVNRLRTRISSEKLADRVRRMQVKLETAAKKSGV